MSAPRLVSITVPCYNSASSLAWALASVKAQTYDRWECLVVDDGSEDRPGDVVSVFGDSRIRLLRLDQNVGRARARQVALDAASGDFLAKLDADDWLYPNKLERQVCAMERHREAALVSAGIAIEDERQQLVGVRGRGTPAECETREPLARPMSPPVSRATSMLRMEVAKNYRYKPYLRRSEDADYLLNVLLENRYCVLSDVLYVYREYRSSAQRDVLEAYRYRMRMFWSYRDRFLLPALRGTAATFLKLALYWAAYSTGQSGKLVARRSEAPTEDDVRGFSEAHERVADEYRRWFGSRDATEAAE